MNGALQRSSRTVARCGRTSSSADGIVSKTPLPGPIHEAHMAYLHWVRDDSEHLDQVSLEQ
jgi:hypothetical protein